MPSDTDDDLKTTGLEEADADLFYHCLLCSILYLATHNRSDISVTTTILELYVQTKLTKHKKAIFKLIR